MASSTGVPVSRRQSDFTDLSLVVVAGLAFSLTAMFLGVALLGHLDSSRDYVVFWATGQQLAHHANPYDTAALKQIEHAVGLNPGYGVMYMRNLPFALPLVWPLGFLSLRVGALLWTLLLVSCLALSTSILRRMYGKPANYFHWLALSFAPAMICIFSGQTTLFSLLGLVLFLRLHGTRPFLAGLSLWLCILKPHLFLPFGLVLLVWIILNKAYKIVAGLVVAVAVSCGLAYLIDPTAWRNYSTMMRTAGVATDYIPCFSVFLRLKLSPHTLWLPYVPAAIACIWALVYFWPRRNSWNWMKDGSLLMLVSMLTAPYIWIYDQCLAIPALLDGAYRARSRHLITIIALLSLPIVIGLMCAIRITSPLYLWTTPAWLIWYLFARRSANQKPATESPIEVALPAQTEPATN
jgi:hypothetical protein